MTHYLRLYHDAILVGTGTAKADDPSLNCRYPGASPDSQPRPVIVDPHARWDASSSKVAKLATTEEGKAPWIIHHSHDVAKAAPWASNYERLVVSSDVPQSAPTGPPGTSHGIPWQLILRTLGQKGVGSIMVEGGATVINDLISQPDIIDSVIVTIAPTWLGQGGVAVSPASKIEDGRRVNSAYLTDTAWRQFGQDAVLCGKLK